MSGELLNAIGAASAVFLASAGSAYASAHSGRFALRAHHNLGLKSLVFIIMSGEEWCRWRAIFVLEAFRAESVESARCMFWS